MLLLDGTQETNKDVVQRLAGMSSHSSLIQHQQVFLLQISERSRQYKMWPLDDCDRMYLSRHIVLSFLRPVNLPLFLSMTTRGV